MLGEVSSIANLIALCGEHFMLRLLFCNLPDIAFNEEPRQLQNSVYNLEETYLCPKKDMLSTIGKSLEISFSATFPTT